MCDLVFAAKTKLSFHLSFLDFQVPTHCTSIYSLHLWFDFWVIPSILVVKFEKGKNSFFLLNFLSETLSNQTHFYFVAVMFKYLLYATHIRFKNSISWRVSVGLNFSSDENSVLSNKPCENDGFLKMLYRACRLLLFYTLLWEVLT